MKTIKPYFLWKFLYILSVASPKTIAIINELCCGDQFTAVPLAQHSHHTIRWLLFATPNIMMPYNTILAIA